MSVVVVIYLKFQKILKSVHLSLQCKCSVRTRWRRCQQKCLRFISASHQLTCTREFIYWAICDKLFLFLSLSSCVWQSVIDSTRFKLALKQAMIAQRDEHWFLAFLRRYFWMQLTSIDFSSQYMFQIARAIMIAIFMSSFIQVHYSNLHLRSLMTPMFSPTVAILPLPFSSDSLCAAVKRLRKFIEDQRFFLSNR